MKDYDRARWIGYMAMARRAREAGDNGRCAYWLTAAGTTRRATFKRQHYMKTRELLTFELGRY